jgi:hypothetical protein
MLYTSGRSRSCACAERSLAAVTPGDNYRKLPFNSTAFSVRSHQFKRLKAPNRNHLAVMLKDNAKETWRNKQTKNSRVMSGVQAKAFRVVRSRFQK